MTDARNITVTLEWRFPPQVRTMALYIGSEMIGEVWPERAEWRGSFIPRGASPRLLFAESEAEAMAAVEAAVIEALGGKNE